MISIGYTVSVVFASAFTVGSLVGYRFCRSKIRQLLADGDKLGIEFDVPMFKWIGRGLAGVAIVTVVVWVAGTWPSFDMDYHRYDAVSGEVTKLDKRMIDMSEKYVVYLDDGDQQYACLDTRCAGVKEGDSLELACIKVWQWYGTPGYDCEFVAVGSRA